MHVDAMIDKQRRAKGEALDEHPSAVDFAATRGNVVV